MSSGFRTRPGPLSKEITGVVRAEIARRHDIKQGQVAVAAGISTAQMSDILTDKKTFDIEQLDRVCHVLGFRLSDVVADAERVTASRHAEPDAVARRL